MLFLSLLVWVDKRTMSMHCCELLHSLALCMLSDLSVTCTAPHSCSRYVFLWKGILLVHWLLCCLPLTAAFFLSFFFFSPSSIFFFPLSPTTFCFLLSLKVVRRYRVAHEVYLIAVSISFDLIALSALLSPVWFSLHASPTPLIF